jgi:hypothetical protein
MSSRRAALAARRGMLQAECALQRDDVRQLYGGIEGTVSRVDRAIETVRSLAPVVLVGGAAILFAVGPHRALRLLRRGLAVTLYANQALRILR